MHLCAPPKFKILVANLKAGSDPSLNTGGNPVKARTGFVLQAMILPNGTTRLNGPTQKPPPVSAVNYTASITVLNPTYWDPAVAAPGPFYYKEEIRVGDQYALASADFGQGHGSGTGPVAAIAAELAAWINTNTDRVFATSVAGVVYITDAREEALFPIQATVDMMNSVGGGSAPWTIQDNAGTTITVVGQLRRSFYLPKPVKSQLPPTILP